MVPGGGIFRGGSPVDYTLRINLASGAIVGAIALGVSLVVSVGVGAWSYRERGRSQDRRDQTMTVKGSARHRVTSDLGVWKITISGEASSLEEAFAVLDASQRRVGGFLADAGFTPPEVEFSAIRTETHYRRDERGNDTREVAGYSLGRVATITSRTVDRVAKAAGEITGLLRQGVLVRSSPPYYYFTKLPDEKVTILGDASRDAHARAVEVAGSVGSSVGEVRSVAMGPLQVVQPNSTEVSAGGLYDTSTIEKDVTAVVTVTFAVARP